LQRLPKRIHQLDAIDVSWCTHVFGVQAHRPGGPAGAENHAVPMREAKSLRQPDREVERTSVGCHQGKDVPERPDMVGELD